MLAACDRIDDYGRSPDSKGYMHTMPSHSVARRTVLSSAFAFSLCVLGFAPPDRARAAESYPVKPIRLVHGYPGSSTEANARYIGAKLTELLGPQVIVDARAGATG